MIIVQSNNSINNNVENMKMLLKHYFNISVDEIKKDDDKRVEAERKNGAKVHSLNVFINDNEIRVSVYEPENKKNYKVYSCYLDDGTYIVEENVFESTSFMYFIGKSLLKHDIPFSYKNKTYICSISEDNAVNIAKSNAMYTSASNLTKEIYDKSSLYLGDCYNIFDLMLSKILAFKHLYKVSSEDVINSRYTDVKSIYQMDLGTNTKLFVVVLNDKSMKLVLKINDRCYGFSNIIKSTKERYVKYEYNMDFVDVLENDCPLLNIKASSRIMNEVYNNIISLHKSSFYSLIESIINDSEINTTDNIETNENIFNAVNFALSKLGVQFKDLKNVKYYDKMLCKGYIGDDEYSVLVDLVDSNKGNVFVVKESKMNLSYEVLDFPFSENCNSVSVWFDGVKHDIYGTYDAEMKSLDLNEDSKAFLMNNFHKFMRTSIVSAGEVIEAELPSIESFLSQIYDLTSIKHIVGLKQTYEEQVKDIYCVIFKNGKMSFVVKSNEVFMVDESMDIVNGIKEDSSKQGNERYFMINGGKLIEVIIRNIKSVYYKFSPFNDENLKFYKKLNVLLSK